MDFFSGEILKIQRNSGGAGISLNFDEFPGEEIHGSNLQISERIGAETAVVLFLRDGKVQQLP